MGSFPRLPGLGAIALLPRALASERCLSLLPPLEIVSQGVEYHFVLFLTFRKIRWKWGNWCDFEIIRDDFEPIYRICSWLSTRLESETLREHILNWRPFRDQTATLKAVISKSPVCSRRPACSEMNSRLSRGVKSCPASASLILISWNILACSPGFGICCKWSIFQKFTHSVYIREVSKSSWTISSDETIFTFTSLGNENITKIVSISCSHSRRSSQTWAAFPHEQRILSTPLHAIHFWTRTYS